MKVLNLAFATAYLMLTISYPYLSADLFNQSLVDIPDMQENDGFDSLTRFLTLLQHPTVMTFVVGFLWAYYLAAQSSKAMFFVVMPMLVRWQGSLLQQSYMGSRPFWVTHGSQQYPIKNLAKGCSTEFGAPNLDLMVSTYVYLIAYLNYYYEVGGEAKKFGSVMCTGYIIKMGITSSMITIFIGFFFTGSYLGQTSYDQAALSMALGVLLAFWFHFGVKIHFKLLPLYFSREFKAKEVWEWFRKSSYEEVPVRQRQFNSQSHRIYHVGPAAIFLSLIFLLVIPMSVTIGTWTAHQKSGGQQIGQLPINLAEELQERHVNTSGIATTLFYQKGNTKLDEVIVGALYDACYKPSVLTNALVSGAAGTVAPDGVNAASQNQSAAEGSAAVGEKESQESSGPGTEASEGTGTTGAGGARRQLRIRKHSKSVKRKHKHKTNSTDTGETNEVKIKFHKFQAQILFGFGNEAYLNAIGFLSSAAGALCGFLFELGFFQKSLKLIPQEKLYGPLCAGGGVDPFKMIRYILLMVFSFVFFFLHLLTDYTRGLSKSKAIINSKDPKDLAAAMEQDLEFTGYFNQLFCHFVGYFLVFAFGRKLMHLLIMTDIVPELQQNAIQHTDMLDKLDQIEKEHFYTDDGPDNDNQHPDEFEDEQDFDSIGGAKTRTDYTSGATVSGNLVQRQKRQNFQKVHDTSSLQTSDIELQYQ